MNTERKPTASQRRTLNDAIDHAAAHGNTDAYVVARRDVFARMRDAGWVEEGTARVTREGYQAVARADLFAMPDVRANDLLAYVTHPGCVVRVVEVYDGGRRFSAEYVTACATCRMADRDMTPAVAGALPGPVPHRMIGAWTTPAYLVRPITGAFRNMISGLLPACGKDLRRWPFGNCTLPLAHDGDCDRIDSRPRRPANPFNCPAGYEACTGAAFPGHVAHEPHQAPSAEDEAPRGEAPDAAGLVWAGRTYGQLTRDEQRRVVAWAIGRLRAELTHPAFVKALSDELSK
jgi:hypothetical protein